MCEDCEALEERLDDLEEYIEFVQNDHDAWKENVYQPQKQSAAAERDDARQQRVELQAAVDALQSRVTELERKLDSVVGVDDAKDSNPEKRANDLRLALIRDAEERGDSHDQKSQMWWEDVQQFFARTGHGEVSKPDCYKAMKWASGEEEHAPASFQPGAGFAMTTKTNPNGHEVMAVKVDVTEIDPAELPSYQDSAVERPSSDATTGLGQGNPAERVK